jgi:hypothetical protein
MASAAAISLDDDGNCYVSKGSRCYCGADFNLELAKLEGCLNALHATLKTPYDDAFIAQKREALCQQGMSLLTLQVESAELLIQ